MATPQGKALSGVAEQEAKPMSLLPRRQWTQATGAAAAAFAVRAGRVGAANDTVRVAIATPNHWHALMTAWACQAGKDVYVEKPVSHTVVEGRRMIEAARKHRRIVQAGTQNRSCTGLQAALAWLREGHIGPIKLVRGFDYPRREGIGKTQGPQAIPEACDYHLYQGPAPLVPLRRRRLHYDWHWFWDTGDGDCGNEARPQHRTRPRHRGSPWHSPRPAQNQLRRSRRHRV
jgi:hypothetical protein